MKKQIINVVLVLALVFSFSLISLADDVLIVNSYLSDPVPKAGFEELVKAFEARNPGVDVQVSTTAHEDFKNSVRIWLTSDNPPDVITWFAGERASYFVEKGLIMDITDVWEEEGLDHNFPKAFKSISFVGDKAYFMPNNWYWWSVFYRKDIFAKYNLKEPDTWEEFLSVCETLKEKGITPIAIGTKFRWTAAGWFDYLNLRVNGLDFHINLMLGKEKYNDPRVKNLFIYWKELLDKGYFLDSAASYSWQEAVRFLNNGEAAMYLMGQFLLDSVTEDVMDKIDFFRFPIIDPTIPVAEDTPTDGFMIPQKAKHPELAKKFLKFLASEEGQSIYMKKTGRIGIHNELPMDIYPKLTQKGVRMIQQTDELAQFYDRDTVPTMADKGMDAFMKFWAYPEQINQILDELERERQRIYSDM